MRFVPRRPRRCSTNPIRAALEALERRHRRCGSTGAHDGARRLSARDPLFLPRQQRRCAGGSGRAHPDRRARGCRAARRTRLQERCAHVRLGKHLGQGAGSARNADHGSPASRGAGGLPGSPAREGAVHAPARSRLPHMRRSIRGRISRRPRASWALPGVLKTRRMGYDGKGQFVVERPEDIDAAWVSIGAPGLIYEKFQAFSREVSIVGARSAAGDIVYYPLSANTHGGGILRYGIAPYANRALERTARIYLKRVHDRSRVRRGAHDRVLRGQGPADRQRDGAASAQFRPLDHRRLRHQSIREPSARHLRSAARAARAPWDTPP